MYSLITRRPTVFDIWDSFNLLDSLDPTYDLANRVRGLRVEKKLDRIEVSLDLPGVPKEDVEALLERDLLTIKWKRGDAKYSENVRLDFNPSDLEAKLVDGVLTVVAHIPLVARVRKIAIS